MPNCAARGVIVSWPTTTRHRGDRQPDGRLPLEREPGARQCLLAFLAAFGEVAALQPLSAAAMQASNPYAFGWDVEAVLHGEAAAPATGAATDAVGKG